MGCCCYCLCPFLLICNIFLYWLIFPHTETYTKFVAVLMCATLATFRNDRSNKLNIFEIGSILITFPCLGLFFNFNDFNSVSLATLISTLSIGLIVARRVTIRISKDLEDALTPCEIKIFCQIIFAIFYSSLLCEFDSHKANTSCPSNISVRILQILFTGLPLVCGSVFLRPSRNSKVLYTTLSAGIISVYIRIFVQINNEPIKWLLKFLIKNETRVFLLEFWASLFILGLCFCYLSSIRIISLPQSVARKFFHLIAIPVFLSGLKNDPEFLFFLSACCLWVFIVLELIRLRDPSFLGPLIDYLFESLRNEFDQGLIVRTHIYLLTGYSASLWMAPSFHSMHLCTISGIVSIGIGDTMAAVIGTYIGKHKWPNSKKSLEGTMAAVISQFICTIFIAKYLSIPFDYYSLIILSVASSILEATLGSIDNLVLPLYFNILCILMGSPNPLRTFLFSSR